MKSKLKSFLFDEKSASSTEEIEEILIKSMALVGILDSINLYTESAKKMVFSGEVGLATVKFYLTSIRNSVIVAEKLHAFLEKKAEVRKEFEEKAIKIEKEIKTTLPKKKSKDDEDKGGLN